MAARGVAKNGNVHDAESRAVAEMVNPSEDLHRQRVGVLFDWLAENHGAKAREDFEKLHGRHDRGDAPVPGENKGEPENVVGKRGQQSASKADHNCTPELPIAALAIEHRE